LKDLRPKLRTHQAVKFLNQILLASQLVKMLAKLVAIQLANRVAAKPRSTELGLRLGTRMLMQLRLSRK
jgi:hypothetical protein